MPAEKDTSTREGVADMQALQAINDGRLWWAPFVYPLLEWPLALG